MIRKMSALLLCLVCAVACLACGNDTSAPITPGTPTRPTTPTEPTIPSDPAGEDMTLETLIRDYGVQAERFVRTYIRPQAVQDKTVKSETAYLEADENNNVTKAHIAFIYSGESTQRIFRLATVTLDTPVQIRDIADEKQLSVNATATSEDIYTFDSDFNYDNRDVADALYEIMEYDSQLKLLQEFTPESSSRVGFKILLLTDNKIKAVSAEVTKGNGSHTTLLKNIQLGNIFNTDTVSERDVGGIKVYATPYTPEEPSEGEDPTPTPEDPDPVTNAELIAALEEYCKDDVLYAALSGLTVNKENIFNEQWYISKDSDNKITGAEYAFNYLRNENSAIFAVGTIEFTSAVSAQDIKSGKLDTASYAKGYRINYDPAIQEERAELTNAICDTLFGEKEGAVRYIVDSGATTDATLGMQAGLFRVIEIHNQQIEEKNLNIKIATTDSQYIDNLQNSSYWRITAEKSYTISGEKLIV